MVPRFQWAVIWCTASTRRWTRKPGKEEQREGMGRTLGQGGVGCYETWLGRVAERCLLDE